MYSFTSWVRYSETDEICIVRANSPWVYINTDIGRPAQPDEAEKSAYGLEEKISMDYVPRKIKLPENMKEGTPTHQLHSGCNQLQKTAGGAIPCGLFMDKAKFCSSND